MELIESYFCLALEGLTVVTVSKTGRFLIGETTALRSIMIYDQNIFESLFFLLDLFFVFILF